MKRLLKNWVFWAFVVPPFASLAVLMVGHSRSEDICRSCVSTRVRNGFYVGTRDHRLPVFGWEPELFESWCRRDFLPASHVHIWYLTRLTTSNLIGSQSGVTTASPPNRLADAYQSNPAFREFLLAKIKKGEVVQEDVLEALRLPRFSWGPPPYETQRLLDLWKSWEEEFAASPGTPER